MRSNIDIAQDAKAKPIEEIAEVIGIEKDELIPYGRYMAKVPLSVLKRYDARQNGKLVLTTAITPTPAGEGKTVTTIGLVQALGRLDKKVMGALREPSLGPTFGIKGGATGGGFSQVYPMWDIDLHFTGDIHAVAAAHNLLSAILENHISRENSLHIDPTRIMLRKAMDMSCRELRNMVVGLGGRSEGGTPHESGFIITAASEISAVLALATSMPDLKKRLGRIIVAYTYDGKPVTAEQLNCVGAMALLLKDALSPNLVQTLEGDPMFIHGFPFANIAHGNNSILATKYALKLADIVVTEAGFAADLGAEKFFDIVCRANGLRPDCAVIVCSIRALKMHGGAALDAVCHADCLALRKGFDNLDKHIQNIHKFGVPVVVAINFFDTDTSEEIEMVRNHCAQKNVRCAVSRVFSEGGKGGKELAEAVLDVLEKEKADFRFLYEVDRPLKEKIKTIATEIYGAAEVIYEGEAERNIKLIEQSGFGDLPICMAKTQLSITDNPKLKGAPHGWTLKVREVLVSAGAGFVVPVCGQMMLIPGLPSEPAAVKMDIDDNGRIIGLN
ncbi:MAG: Formate--tetrahydrofolate ligase [Methanomassiliicoccales archaeon PtaU1.Bin124]|nr:MAG: Formate--tetrahydrofolate ligase [Methanomassiliicoccales archaeon PtaU1.Bin124]